MTTDELDIFNHSWKPGWQLDLEYHLPRLVFYKDSSACYVYESKDFKEHLRTCSLTNLEYLEGLDLYKKVDLRSLRENIMVQRFELGIIGITNQGDK